MKQNLTLLSIKIPRHNEKNEKAMEYFINSLHGVLKNKTTVSLEITSLDNFLSYYIAIPKQYVSAVESQLYANYQDIEVEETNDWTNNLKGSLSVVEIKFRYNSFYPVKTYHHMEDNMLQAIAAFIAKNSEGDRFFLQLLLTKLGNRFWQRGVRGLLYDFTGRKKNAEGKPTPSYFKFTRNLYLGRLRLGFVSKNASSSRTNLHILSGFTKLLKGASNKLVENKYTIYNRGKNLETAIRNRSFAGIIGADFWMPAEIATVYHFPYHQGSVANVVQTSSRKAPPPDVLPLKSTSDARNVSFFGITNYRNTRSLFGMYREDRRRHLYIVGKTGSGKSKLMEILFISDMKDNQGCCFLDPHGDSADEILKHVPRNRIKDVIYINPADREFPIAFNPLEYTDDYEQRQRIARFFVAIFKKIFARDWNERMEHVLRYIILALLETRDSSVLGITRILSDATYRQNVVRQLTDPVVQSFWANEFASYNEQYSSQAIVPLLNKVGQFVANPVIRNIIGQQKNILDFEAFMNEGKIVIINLSKGKLGEDNIALLGSMFITRIQQAALARARFAEEQRRDFYFYIDEFQNFATEAFETILSEARKYRLNLTIAHQYIDQLPADVRSTVFGNIGSLIIFAVGGNDSEYLAKEFAPVFAPDDMINLEAREMYLRILIKGRIIKPFSGRTIDTPKIEKDYSTQVIDFSRSTYAKNRLSVEQEIKQWSEGSRRSSEQMTGEQMYPEPII